MEVLFTGLVVQNFEWTEINVQYIFLLKFRFVLFQWDTHIYLLFLETLPFSYYDLIANESLVMRKYVY